MKTIFRSCCSVAFFVVLLAGTGTLRAQTEPAAGNAAPPAVKLDKGMTAAQITKLIGKPTEVAPIQNTDGKAERWIYRWPVKPASPTAAKSFQVLTLLMINSELVVAQQTVEPKAGDGK